jgi:secreted trypsin-like serine protease
VNGSSKWFIFGVTSFGAQDCAYYSNSVYTKVSNFVKWIRGITRITY